MIRSKRVEILIDLRKWRPNWNDWVLHVKVDRLLYYWEKSNCQKFLDTSVIVATTISGSMKGPWPRRPLMRLVKPM